MSDKKLKLIVIIIGVMLAAIIAGTALILTWALQPDNVLTIKNSPFPTKVIRPTPTTNGVAILNVDYCKNLDVNGTVRISFVSPSREVFLPLSKERSDTGCKNIDVPVIIPKDLAPDTYRIKFHSIYNVNPLKQGVFLDYTSKEFTV